MLWMMFVHRITRRRQQARNPSTTWRCLVLMLGILAERGIAGADAVRTFRCESEEDLDGSTCRVDMLPDTALAQMVYERGFDPEGADRLQLLDAVMQLLDYEAATGEDLREMEYIPDYEAMAAAETAAAEKAALELQEAAAATAYQEVETATMVGAEGEVLTESGIRNPDEEETSSPYSTTEGEDDSNGNRTTQNMEPHEEAKAGVMEGTGEAEGLEKQLDQSTSTSTSTLLGFVKDLGAEVLSTMKRDLNAIVGLFPGPVAKPIREVAAAVEDTVVRFVVPAMEQAERYTRGLRRGAKAAAGKVALRLRDDLCPRVGRNIVAMIGEIKRRVLEAVSKRGGKGVEDEDEAEGGQQHVHPSA